MFTTEGIRGNFALVLVLLIAVPPVFSQDPGTDEAAVILSRGDHCFNAGRYDSSAFFFEKYLSLVVPGPSALTRDPATLGIEGREKYLKALLQLGTSYNLNSQPEKALAVLHCGLTLAGTGGVNERRISALFYYETGNAALLAMDPDEAAGNYRKALALAPADEELALRIHQNLGGICFFKEDFDNAIDHFQKALLICSSGATPDLLSTAELLINTGSAFEEKHEYPRAETYFSKAGNLLKCSEQTDPRQYAELSLSLGNLYMKMDSMKEAQDQLMNAARIYELYPPEEKDRIALLYSGLARLYEKRRNFDTAVSYYHRAIDVIPENSQNRYARILSDLNRNTGKALAARGKLALALEYYGKARELLLSKGNDPALDSGKGDGGSPEIPGLLRISGERAHLLYVAGLQQKSDSLVSASFQEYRSAIRSIDRVNREIGREGSRLLFNESVKDLYYGALEAGYFLSTHGQVGLKDILFQVSEKSRNKILLSGFMNQVAKKSSGIPDTLLVRDKMLSDEISLCMKHMLASDGGASEGQGGNYLYYLAKLFDLRQQTDSLQVHYENASPVYRKIREQEAVIDWQMIRDELLGDEAFLTYFIGDSSLFIFEVTKQGLDIRRITGASSLEKEMADFNREIRLADHSTPDKTGYELYRRLILPVASSLVNIRKLIIIPDETLATIPFEALVINDAGRNPGSGTHNPAYLVNRFEISYQFSSSLWLMARKRDPAGKDSMSFTGFAPVNFASPGRDGMKEQKTDSLATLPYSGMEIRDIAELVMKNGGKARLFLEREATEKNFRACLGYHTIMHIATHSVINDQMPSRSGLVLYHDPGEESGNPNFDGMLYLDEIFNLSAGSDLVILSSCATGAGKITRSEGVLAMTRGFFTAGAPQIIYTLWNITDKNTRNFMVSFYRRILAGEGYSSALRNTKIEMIRHPETSLPRVWAPYLLLGR